jgi:PKD repeat protein
MKKYFFLLLIGFCFLGCAKKQIPASTSNNVVFAFEGKIGGNAMLLEAGKNGIYMKSSFYKDADNLTTLKSEFSQQGCINCDSFLSFELKDIDTTKSLSLIDGIQGVLQNLGSNVINSYSIDSIQNVLSSEVFTFMPEFQAGTHQWLFGDGTTSNDPSPTHNYLTNGLVPVTHVVINQGIVDSITNFIDVTQGSLCRPYFEINVDSTSTLVTCNATNPNLTGHVWDFGSGTFGSGNPITQSMPQGFIQTITMSVSSPTCSTMTYHQNANLTGNANYPIANFSFNTIISSLTQSAPRINKSAFIITWFKNGKTYKSYKNDKNLNQSNNPVFVVNSLVLYDNNERNEKTIKLDGNVNTYLYNVANSNDSIKIESKRLAVAAAYPN